MPLGADGPAPAFAAALARLGDPVRIALAVSGGADSIAMAILAAERIAARGGAGLALTVDHALRAGSREDALFARDACRDMGLEARILSRRGPAPKTGVQAFARAARYVLLAQAAAAWGADALLVAHTADDQAETCAMRARRSVKPRSLAGMAEAAWIAAGPGAPVRLVRPLLGVRRAALREALRASGAQWREDPSNLDARFERVRMRATLAAAPQEAERLLARAAAARAEVDAADAAAAALFLAAGGRFDEDGSASLDAASADAPLAARLVRAAGAGRAEPGEDHAEAALAAARRTGAASLGGAILAARRGRLTIYREPAAVLGRVGVAPLAPRLLAPGQRVLFDARFIVECGTEPALLAARGGAGPGAASPSTGGAPARIACLVEERFTRRANRFHEHYDIVTQGDGAAVF